MKHSLSLAAFLAAMVLAAASPAAIADFGIPAGAEITLPGQPGRLAVTPDDRFVLILQDNKTISVLDTWNFAILPGSISLTATPVSIAIAPDGDTAFITLTSGKIAQADISTLPDLMLGETVSITATDMSLSFADSIGDIAITNLSGSTTNCVFVIDGDSLKWFKQSVPGTTPTDITPADCLAREVEGGEKYAFLLCDDDSTVAPDWGATLRQFQCTSGVPSDVTVIATRLGDSGNILGLSLAADDEWLVVGDTVNKKLQLLNASPTLVGTDTVGPPFAVGIAMQEVLATDFAAETGPIAFALDNTDLLLAQMNLTPDAFTGDTILSLPTAGGGFLARSSSADQYVYLSLAGGDTMAVVTANPWVEITAATLTPGDTTGQGTLAITFTSDLGGTFEIKRASAFKSGTPITGGSGTLAAGESVTKTLDLTGLTAGQNIISVEVKAGARTGRDAVAVSQNPPPSQIRFSLAFGTAKIIVTFTALAATDIERYEIYYDTNGSAPFTTCSEVSGDTVKPKVTVTSFSPGEKETKEITGLVNGQTYYVQIVAWDDTGQCSISGQQSILVEKVVTLTDLAGEDGGYDCFGISPAGRGGGVWMLAAPLLAVGLFRLGRRWRRGH